MRSVWLTKLVIILALALVPLQNVAATLAALHCAPSALLHSAGSQASGDQDTHEHPATDGNGHEHHGATGSGLDTSSGDYTGHFCCHMFVSAPPSFGVRFTAPDFAPLTSTGAASDYYTFLARPQRPPLV